MFGSLGFPELLFILVLALLIFGPRRLPEVGRTLGRALGEFRRATHELKRSIDTEVSLEEAGAVPPASGPRAPRAEPAPAAVGGAPESPVGESPVTEASATQAVESGQADAKSSAPKAPAEPPAPPERRQPPS